METNDISVKEIPFLRGKGIKLTHTKLPHIHREK